jgi:hypothetical protein
MTDVPTQTFHVAGCEDCEAETIQGAVAMLRCARQVALPPGKFDCLAQQIIATAQAPTPSSSTIPDAWGLWSMNQFLDEVRSMKRGGFLED